MKARSLIALALLAGAIALFLLWPALKPKTEAARTPVREVKTNAPEPLRAATEKAQVPPGKTDATNGPLAGAYEMAAFIDHIYGPAPRETIATPDPVAVNSLVSTGDAVFRHRFEQKYGLDPRVVTNIMGRIRDVRIYGLSPAEVQIPLPHF